MDPARRGTRRVLDVPPALPIPSLQDAIASINAVSTESDFQLAKDRSDIAYDVEKKRKQEELRETLAQKGAEIVKKKVDNNASAVATRKRHDEMIWQLALALRRREAESKVVTSALLAAYEDLSRFHANAGGYPQGLLVGHGQTSHQGVALSQHGAEMTNGMLGRPEGSPMTTSVSHMEPSPAQLK